MSHCTLASPSRVRQGCLAVPTVARRPWSTSSGQGIVQANDLQEGSGVDNPAGYLHLGFIVISWPNLALIGSMVALFVIALMAPFPRRRSGNE